MAQANGGIIGPVNDPVIQNELVTTVTARHRGVT